MSSIAERIANLKKAQGQSGNKLEQKTLSPRPASGRVASATAELGGASSVTTKHDGPGNTISSDAKGKKERKGKRKRKRKRKKKRKRKSSLLLESALRRG